MFEKKVYSAKFLSPLKNFEEDEQPIEYRRDPLLGKWCRINVKRTQRVKQGQERANYFDLIEKSREGCFFCPENLEKSTPKFTREIASEGRIRCGDSVVFPNLFPFSTYHAIATVTRQHFKELNEFTVSEIVDTLKASLTYFRRVNAYDHQARYPSFNWNHLPPSGASIVHPHVQLMVDRDATFSLDFYLQASKNYWEKNRKNFWEELVKREKGGERFIATTGNICWFTSFVPLGNNEVNAVFQGKSGLLELRGEEISSFADGLVRVFRAYYKMGVRSFNLTTYSSPIGEKRQDFWLNVKIISRPSPNAYYTADAGFMEILHRERIVESMPEKVAEIVREEF